MAIPQKPKPSFLKEMKTVLATVPKLPKGKLLKLTCVFFVSSLGIFCLFGPAARLRFLDRNLKDAEELYKIAGRSPTRSNLGNEFSFIGGYGLNYKEVKRDQ